MLSAILSAASSDAQQYNIYNGSGEVIGTGDQMRVMNKETNSKTYQWVNFDDSTEILFSYTLQPGESRTDELSAKPLFGGAGGVQLVDTDDITSLCAVDCFPATTVVATPNQQLTRIETLEAGDSVLTGTGTTAVIDRVVRGKSLHLISLSFGAHEIRCTRGHLLKSADRGRIPASEFKAGDVVCARDGGRLIVSTVTKIALNEPTEVFSLVLSDGDSVLIGTAGVVAGADSSAAKPGTVRSAQQASAAPSTQATDPRRSENADRPTKTPKVIATNGRPVESSVRDA